MLALSGSAGRPRERDVREVGSVNTDEHSQHPFHLTSSSSTRH